MSSRGHNRGSSMSDNDKTNSDDSIPPAVNPAAVIDDDGRLACDAACGECGYNLRGLGTGGRCPECGAPIAASLGGAGLEEAPVRWLRRVHRGVTVLAFTYPAMLLLAAIITWRSRWLGSIGMPQVGLVVGLLRLALGGLSVYAVLLITAREPARLGHSGRSRLRQVTRWAVLLSVAVYLSVRVLPWIGIWWPPAFRVYTTATLGAALVTLLLLTRYLKALFLRIKDEQITSSIGSVADAASFMLFLVILLWTLSLVARGVLDRVLRDGVSSTLDCAVPLSLIGLIATCVLLFQVRRYLAQLIRTRSENTRRPA